MSMKNFNDTIGNRTRDLPACSAVPQPTGPPRAHRNKCSRAKSLQLLSFASVSNIFGYSKHLADYNGSAIGAICHLYVLCDLLVNSQAHHQQTRTPNTHRWNTHAATYCVIQTQISGRSSNSAKHSGGRPEDGREKIPKHVGVLYLHTRF